MNERIKSSNYLQSARSISEKISAMSVISGKSIPRLQFSKHRINQLSKRSKARKKKRILSTWIPPSFRPSSKLLFTMHRELARPPSLKNRPTWKLASLSRGWRNASSRGEGEKESKHSGETFIGRRTFQISCRKLKQTRDKCNFPLLCIQFSVPDKSGNTCCNS